MKKLKIPKTWERTSDWLFPLAFFIAWTWFTGTFIPGPFS